MNSESPSEPAQHKARTWRDAQLISMSVLLLLCPGAAFQLFQHGWITWTAARHLDLFVLISFPVGNMIYLSYVLSMLAASASRGYSVLTVPLISAILLPAGWIGMMQYASEFVLG